MLVALLRVGFYFIAEAQGLVRRRQRYVEDATLELEEELRDHQCMHERGDGRRGLEEERPEGR